MAELPDSVRALFEGANFAHVATVLPDGGPHSVPVWVGLEGDGIAFFTQEGSRKARNIAGDAALAVMDRMSVRYTGKPFPYRESGRAYFVAPERSSSQELPFAHTPSV